MSTDPRLARLQARANTPQATPSPPQTPTPADAAPQPQPPTSSPPPPLQPQPQQQQIQTQSVPLSPTAADNAPSQASPGSPDGNVEAAIPAPAPAPATVPTATTNEKSEIPFKLRFCTVCASNNNRSMEAHLRLSTSEHHYPVISFGTGSYVRLPGPSISQPQVYNFNTTSYTKMYEELNAQDARLYRNNGILNMLDRNRNIKWGPERFHDWVVGQARMDALQRGDKGAEGTEGGIVDVIFTCEERCWDAVVDNLLDRGAPLNRPVHVFNIDIKDNHEEALIGGGAILELADMLNEAAAQERKIQGTAGWENGSGAARQSFDERVPDILATWQEKWPNLPALWTLSWF
ncbi:RNA polymerase II subunit A C-terminal domain phosphatase [Exophiala dermatitidis]|uniref:protein-serine/threonine phosphatase n=1 Tax=Exophiala dermatitidis TaxID=5970 RepID=A0AAN6EVE2_EXODE|nr:RNA polymerase II subunit A C-terminal domain phosphatase [Exophiala dermatitidis]KAJ4505566.1 RNA polymerase II subunit A C-terminal domain phosphatase [Exophiala dermatitidis]KAJ4506070.1 RNA polymerase II subunit A C-terminal domain phosphatase [Exophiala dermatitidis]KAJ4536552.1 RNA polymerase II subunit A C-terminal domain phosphatase [Exophiala dermatitidis]KAJ4555842.1 RNA polymerase II subunit A C-terminal domain phosphatase [Exophiala dermatitidis]